MANQTIPISQANTMIQQYLAYMTDHNIDMETQTHSVSFTTDDLLKWMMEVKDFTDEFRVFLGVYSEGARAGRITAIVWPYKDGRPASKPDDAGKGGGGGSTDLDPFNEGGLQP